MTTTDHHPNPGAPPSTGRSRRPARLVVAAVGALLLVALLPVGPADASWRRVTRNVDSPMVDDVAVCSDGIRVALATSLIHWPEDPLPPTWEREGLLVTTEADGVSVRPRGEVLLELPPDSGVMAPLVPASDPRLPPGSLSELGSGELISYYLIEQDLPWVRSVAPGTTVYLWLSLGSGHWVSSGGPFAAVVAPDGSEGCPVFGEPAPEVVLDPNVLSARDEIGPQIPNLTIFSVSGAELVASSVRFGASGREAPAWTVAIGDTVYGLADLRGRGLGCSATTASVTATTTDGQAVAATARVRPVCVRWLPW